MTTGRRIEQGSEEPIDGWHARPAQRNDASGSRKFRGGVGSRLPRLERADCRNFPSKLRAGTPCALQLYQNILDLGFTYYNYLT
jgi:hypothetical protein